MFRTFLILSIVPGSLLFYHIVKLIEELCSTLRYQYRANQAVQLWTCRFLYDVAVKDFALPKWQPISHQTDIAFLLNLLVIDGSLITDPLVLVDTSQHDGSWRQCMFKVSQFSLVNFYFLMLSNQDLKTH
jgi:hypothetical protein